MGNKEKAEAIAARAFAKSTSGFARVYSLRKVGSIRRDSPDQGLRAEAQATTDLLLTDSGLTDVFSDPEQVVSALGGIDGITDKIAQMHLMNFESAVEAAALIFAHSVLDWAVSEYCRVSASAEPLDWEPSIGGKKLPLRDLRTSGYEDLYLKELDAYLAKFEREPLLKRVDCLFRLCRPAETSSATYSYSRPRLEAIDQLRHKLVHDLDPAAEPIDYSTEVEFLQTTNYFLWLMTMNRYKLRARPDFVVSEKAINS